jgi:hypothetical protein
VRSADLRTFVNQQAERAMEGNDGGQWQGFVDDDKHLHVCIIQGKMVLSIKEFLLGCFKGIGAMHGFMIPYQGCNAFD